MGEERRLYYEDFEVGREDISDARTITEADVVNFACLSGDFNAIHMDAEFARNTPFGQRIAHGMCVLSIADGLWFTLPRLAIVAFLGLDNWRFSRPVMFGDTIKIKRRLAEMRETRRGNRGILTFEVQVLNQNDEVVQEGNWNFMVNKREQSA